MFNDKIAAWAARVQPGSPAPLSPHRFSPASPSFLNLTPPPTTPKLVDLTALGYTTVFVHFPKTPSTPSPYLRTRHPATPKEQENMAPTQQQRSASSTLRRLRSLANLRTRNRSKSTATAPGAGASTSKPSKPATKPTVESKKSKYAHVLPPPPLANDLALMQFADGGSIESHAKRVMKAQARAAAGSHYNSHDPCMGVVYKDGKGNVWWDEDEQYEYAHLLDGENVDMYAYQGNEGTDAWVKFGNSSPSGKDSPGRRIGGLRTPLERRESLSTQESDLMDTRSFIKPAEEPLIVPGLSVLSVPIRARKTALRKPEFLVDVAAFGPRSPGVSKTFAASDAEMPRPKGKARRRPAPIKILPPASTSKKPSNPALPTAGLPSAERTRKEFLENSFEPAPLPQPQPQLPVAYTTCEARPTTTKSSGWRLRMPQVGMPSPTVGKKPSRLDLRAMFGAGIRHD